MTAIYNADCPKYDEAIETGVAEGTNHISLGANKVLIKWIHITTASLSWDLTIYSDTGVSAHAFQIVNDRSGNYSIYLDYPYKDEESSGTELHYVFTDNLGSETHDIRVLSMEMR
jgi:hypothetical protein